MSEAGPSARTVVPLLLGALLASCSGLKSAALPEQTYVLRAAAPVPAAGVRAAGAAVVGAPVAGVPAVGVPVAGAAAPARLAAWLQVARPLPQPGLDGDRIMVVRSDHRLDAFTAARWAAPLPEVVAALAVDTLRAGGRFAGVIDDRAAFAADYQLRITVRHFEAEYAAEGALPRVHVAFDCVLLRRSDRLAVASFSVQSEGEAAGNRMGAVVGAFERSAREALALVQESAAAAITADASAALRTSTAPSPP